MDPQLPGTCYSPHCPPDKAEEAPTLPEHRGVGAAQRIPTHRLDLETREPALEAAEEEGLCRRPVTRAWRVCTEAWRTPHKTLYQPLAPNPENKPRWRRDKDGNPGTSFRKDRRNLPPLPSLPPPPLPSSPPPPSVNRRLWSGETEASADHR